jgi:hypothetical protein
MTPDPRFSIPQPSTQPLARLTGLEVLQLDKREEGDDYEGISLLVGPAGLRVHTMTRPLLLHCRVCVCAAAFWIMDPRRCALHGVGARDPSGVLAFAASARGH